MGKGTISGHLRDGQYSVQLNFDVSRVDDWLIELAAAISFWETKIAGMSPGAEKDLAILKKTALEKRKSYLEGNTPGDPTINAWCADLTKDLSGIVGIIEVPGERGTVLIQPGHGGNAVYDLDRDGQIQPIIASPAAQVFYNLSMLPGWQKWKPNFRFGTITAIDYDLDTCSVDLDAAASSVQSLDVNQAVSISDVPIDYMDCNSGAFEVGDNVLIKFEGNDWASPKVVGFRDNPKSCGWTFTLTRGDNIPLSGDLFDIYFEVRDKNGWWIWDGRRGDPGVSYDGNVWSLDSSVWSDGGLDPDGYFVSYEGGAYEVYSLLTQYPYRYKWVETQQPEDLILSGDYVDTLPYWKLDRIDMTAIDYPGDCPFPPAFIDGYVSGMRIAYLNPGGFVERGYTVNSSVPYRVKSYGKPNYRSHVTWYTTNFPAWVGGVEECTGEECVGTFCTGGVRYAILAKYRVVGGGVDIIGGDEFEWEYPPTCMSSSLVNKVPQTEYGLFPPSIGGTVHTMKIENIADETIEFPCLGDFYTGELLYNAIQYPLNIMQVSASYDW